MPVMLFVIASRMWQLGSLTVIIMTDRDRLICTNDSLLGGTND